MKIKLTELQESYWLGGLNKNPSAFNSYAYFEYSMSKNLDYDLLNKSINILIARHVILKSVIDELGTFSINNELSEFKINTLTTENDDIDERKRILIDHGQNLQEGYFFDINIKITPIWSEW